MGRSIKSLNSDRRCEFEVLDYFYKENGIKLIYTMPYKSQQNSITKRRSRTLLDIMRLMMAHADLLTYFWREELSTTAYILNRVEIKVELLTLYEIWIRKK